VTECPKHPGIESVGTCERCGRFFCAAERLEFDGKSYCGECGARDDVDWLGKHYRKLEGTRSGFVWFLLLLGMMATAGSLGALVNSENWKERGFFLGMLLIGLSLMSLMSGRKESRFVLLGGSVLAAVLLASATDEPWSALLTLPALVLAGLSFTDVRTRLFFRIPVDRVALRRHFDREGSNPLAVRASRLALVGLFVPGVGLLSLVMGVMALTKVNSKAVPPVGNVSAALGAIVFSLFTSLMWVGAFLA
jgi:hypothetical protein